MRAFARFPTPRQRRVCAQTGHYVSGAVLSIGTLSLTFPMCRVERVAYTAYLPNDQQLPPTTLKGRCSRCGAILPDVRLQSARFEPTVIPMSFGSDYHMLDGVHVAAESP